MKAVLAALVVLPVVASADAPPMTGPPGSTEPAVQPFQAAVAPVRAKLGIEARQDVVAGNRGLAAPTAITVPAGKVEVTVQTLIPFAGLGGLNAGLTSTTEVWVEGALAYADEGDTGTELGVGAKQILVRTKNIAIAATGSVRRFAGSGDDERLMGVGGVVTLCVDDGCGLEVSGSLARMWGFHESDYDTNGPGENLVTLSASAGNATTRVMIEAMSIDDETVGFFGVRFGSAKQAIDVALVRPLGEEELDIPGLPWIGFSARL